MHDERRRSRSASSASSTSASQPAVYAATVPLDGRGLAGARTSRCRSPRRWPRTYEPFAVGTPWGRPWCTSWFRVTRRGARRVGRAARSRPSSTSGFVGDWPGYQAEGAGVPRRTAARSRASTRATSTCRSPTRPTGGEQSRCCVEAAANPDILANDFVGPTPLGDMLTAGDEPALHASPAPTSPCSTSEVWHLAWTSRCSRADAGAADEHDPRRHEILRAPGARARRARPGRRRPAPPPPPAPSSPASWPRPRTPARTPCQRRRPRPHRLGVAVADPRDQAQDRPHLRQRHGAGRRLPRVRLRLLAGPAVRVGQGALPDGLASASRRRCGRASGRRSAACGSSPTATCPAARRWPASSSTASGSSSSEFGVETEGVWLPDSFGYTAALPAAGAGSPASSGSSPRRCRGTRPTSSRTTPSGGRASTAPGLHPLPAGRHLQRRVLAARSWPTPCATTPTRARGTRSLVPFGYGDGGGGPTREMLERARRLRRPGGLAAGRRSSTRTTSSPGARRPSTRTRPVWSGELYLELHRATYTTQARPSRATGAASTCCARPSCGRRRPRCTRRATRYPYERARPAVEDGAAAPVPRHPAGLLDRLGAPRGRGDVRAGRAELEELTAEALARAGRRPAAPVGVQRQPARPRRGRRRCPRARRRRPALADGRSPCHRGPGARQRAARRRPPRRR